MNTATSKAQLSAQITAIVRASFTPLNTEEVKEVLRMVVSQITPL